MAARTENAVVIAAPFGLVWDMTNDVPNWPNLYSEYASAEVLEQTDDTVTFRLTMHPDENDISWSWVSERVLDRANGVVTARRIETGPFEYMNIRWTYSEVEGGVELRWEQDFRMKAAAPVTDEQMATRINTNTPVQMELIRRRVEAAALAAVAG
jgi:aromatase